MKGKPRAQKVIAPCAITGSIHTLAMSPYLPFTPDQIVAPAIGAAVVHLHARDPESGRPSQDPALHAQFLSPIREGCGAVVDITTGGGLSVSLGERMAPRCRQSQSAPR